MPAGIKTAISSCRNIVDVSGQWLPPGNYYFKIEQVKSNSCSGQLSSGRHSWRYEFRTKNLLKMMATAQARLSRRAGLFSERMPSYRSPASPAGASESRREMHRRDEIPQVREAPQEVPDCSICLESLSGDPSRRLRCGHTFHESCIARWYQSRPNCPLCRRPRSRRTFRLPSISRRRVAPDPGPRVQISQWRRREHRRIFASRPDFMT
jgi:hypothetical protein